MESLELSRIVSWFCSGMPNRLPIVCIGIIAPISAMKSNRPEPTRGSSARTQNSRVSGSMASIRRGVKTLESKRRWRSCIGGSSNRMSPGGTSIPLRMMSIVVPRPDR